MNFNLKRPKSAFMLIEMLVTIAIIAIIAAILFPVFATAKKSAAKTSCASNLKQLAFAMLSYCDDNNGRYVPAAADIYKSSPAGGHQRWHGYRESNRMDFDPTRGPLWRYVAGSGGIRRCPAAPSLTDLEDYKGAFESGCGGYGYNSTYVGGTYYKNPMPLACELASFSSDIKTPARTVLLADTAMAMKYKKEYYTVEYSFAEPRYLISLAIADDSTQRLEKIPSITPSIHFRHSGCANVAWCDGHVTSEKCDKNDAKNIYNVMSSDFNLGFMGCDNELFDNR